MEPKLQSSAYSCATEKLCSAAADGSLAHLENVWSFLMFCITRIFEYDSINSLDFLRAIESSYINRIRLAESPCGDPMLVVNSRPILSHSDVSYLMSVPVMLY